MTEENLLLLQNIDLWGEYIPSKYGLILTLLIASLPLILVLSSNITNTLFLLYY